MKSKQKCSPGTTYHKYRICKNHLAHIDEAIDKLKDGDIRRWLTWYESQDGAVYLHSNMTWLCMDNCSEHADSKDPSNHCSGISAMFIYPGWNHWEAFP